MQFSILDQHARYSKNKREDIGEWKAFNKYDY